MHVPSSRALAPSFVLLLAPLHARALLAPLHAPRAENDLEVAVRVEALTAAELDALQGALTAGELVSSLPRSIVSVPAAGVRGLSQALVDGTLVRGALTESVPFEHVERIEVLRGPTGTLYGAGAVSGAVSLITRRPTQGGDELWLEVESSSPALAGSAAVADTRAETLTITLPDDGIVFVGGLFDQRARAELGAFSGLAAAGPLGAYLAGSPGGSASSDLYLALGGSVDGALDARLCVLDPGLLSGFSAPSVVVGSGATLGVGALDAWFTRAGAAPLGDERFEVPAGTAGRAAYGATPGLGLTFRPTLVPGGGIRLDWSADTRFPELWGGVLRDTERRLAGTATLAPGQTLALGGLAGERVADAARVPVLGELPVLGGLFRGRDAAAERRNLVVFITPYVVDEDGRASGGGGAPRTEDALLAPAGDDWLATLTLGRTRLGLPDFGWLRTETGGNIQQRPLASFDGDGAGNGFALEVARALDWSFLTPRNPQVVIDARIVDVEESSREDLISAGGLALGIEDPNGSGFLVSAGNGDVTDARFDLDYAAHELGIGIRDDYCDCECSWLTLTGRLRYFGSSYETSLSGVTNSGTLDIRREDDVDFWGLGPSLGATLSKDFGRFKGYVGAEAWLGYGDAEADTRVLVGNFPERARDLDERKFVYDLQLTAGLRHERGDLSFGVEASVSRGNRYPVVEYQEFDPATLELEGATRTFLGVSLGYRF